MNNLIATLAISHASARILIHLYCFLSHTESYPRALAGIKREFNKGVIPC